MLGYGGHFLTKARRYSVTFGQLRDTRTTYRRNEDDEPADTISVGTLTYLGSGWLTEGDALLANTAARQRREQTHRPGRTRPRNLGGRMSRDLPRAGIPPPRSPSCSASASPRSR